ncbi:hypothetical protein RF11_13764 [Thelohanellus kitauei]|uniref:Uncharacterized protein n=1 Tax=Thelohanellus kitauei TaxID=669202 RepID=A0A0C2JBR5_THEKT|nr:hypothetical protein RF11_13764 [Thelohanellus kitauei]
MPLVEIDEPYQDGDGIDVTQYKVTKLQDFFLRIPTAQICVIFALFFGLLSLHSESWMTGRDEDRYIYSGLFFGCSKSPPDFTCAKFIFDGSSHKSSNSLNIGIFVTRLLVCLALISLMVGFCASFFLFATTRYVCVIMTFYIFSGLLFLIGSMDYMASVLLKRFMIGYGCLSALIAGVYCFASAGMLYMESNIEPYVLHFFRKWVADVVNYATRVSTPKPKIYRGTNEVVEFV